LFNTALSTDVKGRVCIVRVPRFASSVRARVV
jgi:hypothetical protein